MSWRVDFFVDIRGGAPVEEFLAGLPVQHKAKALALIKMLEQEGPSLPFPYSSQVRGKLRELRTQQGKDKLRILYFGDAHRVLVLLHGIVKRSAKLPEEDIRTERPRPGWSCTTAGWRRSENDHAVEPVLSKADGRPRTAGNCGAGTGQPAIGSADRQATRFGEAEPDTIGRAGGDERAKDFGNGK